MLSAGLIAHDWMQPLTTGTDFVALFRFTDDVAFIRALFNVGVQPGTPVSAQF